MNVHGSSLPSYVVTAFTSQDGPMIPGSNETLLGECGLLIEDASVCSLFPHLRRMQRWPVALRILTNVSGLFSCVG